MQPSVLCNVYPCTINTTWQGISGLADSKLSDYKLYKLCCNGLNSNYWMHLIVEQLDKLNYG